MTAVATQTKPQQTAASKPPPAEDDFFGPSAAAGGNGSGGDPSEEMDLSDVDENAGSEPIPPGVWPAHLADAEYADSQRSGKKMIAWKFEISEGPASGRQITYYTVIQSSSGVARLKKMLVRIAPQVNLKKFNPTSTPLELVGTPCRLKIVQRVYQGEKRGDIRDILPPAQAKVFAE